ncbi:MAG: hypothetical protein JWN15_1064, partial [Firmicutes bacterium]|nr:hypothetical protein [Bacillota bacterium]
MRKALVAGLIVTVLAVGTAVAAGSETFGGLPVVRVVVNGKTLSVPGVVVEGRSMAPVRAIGEAVGGTVTWDQATYTATITAPDAAQLQAENAKLKADLAALNAKLSAGSTPSPAPEGGAGSSRSNPAPAGSALTVAVDGILDKYTAKVTLLETVRGDAAWQKIKAANMFNGEPKAGMEYIAARFKFELVTIADGKALDLSPVNFDAISSAGREYDMA